MEKTLKYQTRREALQQVAPQFREASSSQKRTLLNAFVVTTGYHRTYARLLLNHAEEVQQTHGRSHIHKYGPDVQHALFLAWHAANRICAKRLIPFLPTLIEALERHEHLQISEKCRKQLLAMSAATADRLLASQCKLSQHGRSTTRAGTLLKQQIPIRTFQEWNETRPGFLEADLVAHCGADIQGGYLYTLTLTDVATGWTECLPIQKRQELTEKAQALDPVRLLHQLEQLQQAVFRCAVGCSPFVSSPLSTPLCVFSVEQCTTGNLPVEESVPDPTAGFETLYREQERRKRVQGWRRTHKDPFEGEGEQIFSWLQVNPGRSSGDIFRELQHRSPGCYQPLQIRTLQRGMRKIRAYPARKLLRTGGRRK